MSKGFIINLLTISTLSTFFIVGDDYIGFQEQQDTLDDVIHDFGVYTDVVHIIFDEEELSDSDDEDYQQPLQEEATNVLKNLTQRQRQDIYKDLLQISTNGTLQRNSTTLIAAKYNVHVRTVQRVWKRAKDCLAQGIPVDVNSLRAKNCGRKKIQVDLMRVVDIPLNRRGTIRSLAYALEISKSTLHRLFKEGLLR
jgi:DNA invertase Pin-like site-specific DNA recombinase